VCDIVLRVDMLAAVCFVRYGTAIRYVRCSCVWCDIDLRVDMLAAAVLGAKLNCKWIC